MYLSVNTYFSCGCLEKQITYSNIRHLVIGRVTTFYSNLLSNNLCFGFDFPFLSIIESCT